VNGGNRGRLSAIWLSRKLITVCHQIVVEYRKYCRAPRLAQSHIGTEDGRELPRPYRIPCQHMTVG
jgi:hypothetical protein